MMRVIGLISGTSVDGIDAALVEITGKDLDINVTLLAGATYPYPDALSKQILEVCGGASLSMAEFAQLDDAIAYTFAQAAQNIQSGNDSADLIGSHGQTVFHRPPTDDLGLPVLDSGFKKIENPKSKMGYSLQLGRGALVAHLTGIPTVSNFRAADIAAGGQGAPMVSGIDAYLLSQPDKNRCVQNIGGIGNVTYLPARRGSWLEDIRGWDTGPGNALLDLAVQYLTNGVKTYDQDGAWAAAGTICNDLVEQWLQQDYFQQQPPKSTGRELFSYTYLRQCIADASAYELSSADLLATLTELTAASIVHSYRTFLPQMPDEVLLCGGGSRNLYLKQRLQATLQPVPVLTTDEAGVNADFKEAIAFAVLAYWRQLGIPGNLPQVTGATSAVLLGEVHLPTKLKTLS
ncbi:anhydro-N-acetylmuramic acid kinase [Coleofasciculus sp. FACHB-1120]|uniref:anhydro-N-acetylmuramic acid kinase n=1 Tax=Coleofasciculus sp. FACHB-1120 TaxID=2692783 RepID=UPI001686996A|nr:anhydro-N-acetylmuramic acid kinase [Coleofasciculus sp. FACHB-1120]MBD2744276.1 anhydro-N-acetylmuramic acid kinase [Coleofasciculus sp. FACHB-1120]